MKANRPAAATAPHPHLVPPVLTAWLSVFRPCFTVPTWNHVLVLVAGAVLAPGKRTVTQALRVMGLGDDPGFGRYHEVLNRAPPPSQGQAAGTRTRWHGGCCFMSWTGCCPPGR